MSRPTTNGQIATERTSLVRLSGPQRLLIFLYLIVAVTYLSWRPLSFNPDAMVFSALVYGAELFGFLCASLYLFMCWRLKERSPLPVPTGMTADVFVPTLNESVDILRRTLMAAQRMQHVDEVWLLDDGNRPEMRALAEQLGCRYLARTDNTDAKAGNINNALKHCSADFIALFDADHAPARNFLQETLGFFTNPKVAFVQTPHEFYNLDSFQHRVDHDRAQVWSEQLLFFKVIQPGKDRLNSAFFCGSCAVIRREALDDVGGIATGTITEDIHTSLRWHARGWESAYFSKPLAFGLAPSTAPAFLKQRLRWGQGAMQTWRREGLLTNQGLSWAQRLSYLATMLTYFEGWQRLVLFFSPAIVLLTGLMPIAAVDFDFLVRFVPYFLLNYWVFEEVGRGYARTVLTEQYTMSRFAVFIAATFGLFLKKLRFVVTPKAMGETDATRRTLWPQYLVLVLNSLAIPAGVVLYLGTGHLPAGALVANILWAALTAWLACLAIAHAMRVARFRRREYRFPVPIPFQITAHDDDSVILVTDVSPAGCKLSGPDVHELRYGEVVRGALILPDAEVRVQAVVRSRTAASGQATGNSVGCEFVWNTPEDQAQLEILLYGSDLQWQFNGLREKARTPMERATGFFKRANHRSPDIASESWAPLLLSSSHVGSSQRVAYISPPDGRSGQRRLAALDSHPDGTTISGMEVTATGARPINGRLSAFDLAEFATSPVHLYRWTK